MKEQINISQLLVHLPTKKTMAMYGPDSKQEQAAKVLQ